MYDLEINICENPMAALSLSWGGSSAGGNISHMWQIPWYQPSGESTLKMLKACEIGGWFNFTK